MAGGVKVNHLHPIGSPHQEGNSPIHASLGAEGKRRGVSAKR